MSPVLTRAFWTGPRLFALVASVLVLTIFIAANIHLIVVSFASNPECALQPNMEGVVALRAARPSC
ncbi:hypothetical protein [Paracoccus pacificus]|uniref:Uncharacterized protein n=1 Tax=Paracoccus pacificus TaxID=1463598 RepID=A0ABW4R9S7_9RHOB